MFKNLFRHKTFEADIRDWLDENGYYGSSTKFEELELHAIGRPGWIQVYLFQIQAKSREDDQWLELHGCLRDDERYKDSRIVVFDTADNRDPILAEWSKGLITKRSRRKRKSKGDS